MKIFLVFLCTLISLSLNAAHVQFSHMDFAQTMQTGRVLNLFPVSIPSWGTNGLTTVDRVAVTNDTTGTVTVSNMLAGTYRGEFIGKWKVTTNYFTVPDTDILVYASNIVSTTTLTASQIAGYTMAQQDARFQKGTQTLTNWSQISTNILATISGGLVSGASATNNTFYGMTVASGDGAGLTNLHGTNIVAGTIEASALSAAAQATWITNGQAGVSFPALTIDGVHYSYFWEVNDDDGTMVLECGESNILFTTDGRVAATAFYGDGSGLTNLHGTNIVAGTIETNALSAAAYEALVGGGGTGQTNWPASAITNATWITNGQAGVVLDGIQLYSSVGNAVITNAAGVLQFDSGAGTKATFADGDWQVVELIATNGVTSGTNSVRLTDASGIVQLGALPSEVLTNNYTGSIVQTNTAQANTFLSLDGNRTTSGNVIEYKTNNVSKFSVTSAGAVTGTSFGGSVDVGNGYLLMSASGYLRLGPSYKFEILNLTNLTWGKGYSVNFVMGGTLTATNGNVMYQLATIPTNSVPASEAGITNFLHINLTNIGPCYVYTNYTDGGLKILRPTLTEATWP